MAEVVAACLVLVSASIFLAHALDACNAKPGGAKRTVSLQSSFEPFRKSPDTSVKRGSPPLASFSGNPFLPPGRGFRCLVRSDISQAAARAQGASQLPSVRGFR
jgi:hypothetical protein